MSSFHKPKIFRSTHGCCICKAKSSSSRFTDSDRYSDSFNKCFLLTEDRDGDICNACVLLIKRWWKLPKNNTRHWAHVVDSRLGPGVKSYAKRKKQMMQQILTVSRRKHSQERRRQKQIIAAKKSANSFSTKCANGFENATSDYHQFRLLQRKFMLIRERKAGNRRKQVHPIRLSPGEQKRKGALSNVLDSKLWKRQTICCGTAYLGPGAMLAIPLASYSPCLSNRNANTNTNSSPEILSESEEEESSTSTTPPLSVMCTRSTKRLTSSRFGVPRFSDASPTTTVYSEFAALVAAASNPNIINQQPLDFSMRDQSEKSSISVDCLQEQESADSSNIKDDIIATQSSDLSATAKEVTRLTTIERIIEEELQSLQRDHECIGDEEVLSEEPSEEVFDGSKMSQDDEEALEIDSDVDEGFFDRNSTSPDSNVSSNSKQVNIIKKIMKDQLTATY